ncbi:DegV family protein [Nocardioides sambongensis]|uniref:DegV family protein n=1 Tax=Nocardioides sambongensis TaxID=2589074 RepID=UPI001E4631B6|nr:DegV family protein [Nocardioides sambongensis]
MALVTDSTAELGLERAAGLGVTVVPLQVVVGDESYQEGAPEVTPERIAEALRHKRPVSTSRAAPAHFAELYARLAEEGAGSILSVHVSSQVSGTFESAQAGARQAPVPVRCLDSRQIGPATGFATEAAAAVLADGGSLDDAYDAALARAAACRTLLYVDTLEYLRRGGRVSNAAALFGGALAVKPLLGVEDGLIVPVARVRTSVKAIARLQALAVEAAGEQRVEVFVAHLAATERAEAFAASLAEELGERLVGDVRCREIGAVLGAHVGPGMLATCIAPVLT